MTEERILTKHPQKAKQGTNISKAKYTLIRETILEFLRMSSIVGFGDLMKLVEKQLKDEFDGSISWYVTTVKLDLEARNLIERVPDVSPQQLRIVER
jgi:hypothetical protein